jgi:hypothetical protein
MAHETQQAQIEVAFRLLKTPSNSKGWARMAADAGARRLIESRTGNEWVSADHSGSAAPGEEIVLRVQESLAHGKGRTARQEVKTYTYRLVAEDGAACQIGETWRDYTVIAVTGARMIERS